MNISSIPNSVQRVADALIEELGDECVLLGQDVTGRSAGIWRSDNIQATVLVRPKNTDEVSRAMKVCDRYDQPVVAHGGLTGLVESGLTQANEVVISLERMQEIEAIYPAERTAIVQSGVVLQTLQEAVQEHGLIFPLDLGSRGSCTVGGNISTNAGGNRVIRYGMTRDMVLGLEAVLADGTIVSSMNQMIKNNAGYDLKQLFIGTEGTLGIVTKAVLRCRSETATQPTAMVGVAKFSDLVEFLQHVDAGFGGALSAFEVMWNNYYQLVTTEPANNTPPLASDYPFYVLVEALGADETLFQNVLMMSLEKGLVQDAVIASSEAQRMQLWGIRDDVEQTFRFGPVFLFDVSLRIPFMEDYVQQVNENLKAQLPNCENYTLGHMGDGNLHFAVSTGTDGENGEDTRRIVEECIYNPLAAIGGSVSAEHGVGLEKKPYLHLARSASEMAVMRTLKKALDPKGLLNRNKIFDIES